MEKDPCTIPNLGSITSTASLEGAPKSRLPNIATAAELGVTMRRRPETLRIGTVGDYDQFAQLNLSQRQVPIVVKLATDARQDL